MTGRRVLAALVAGAIAGAGLLADPAAAATGPQATLVVAPEDGGVLRQDRPLRLAVQVTNTGPVALRAGTLAFSLESQPEASAAALLQKIAKPPEVLLGQALPGTADVPPLAAGATAVVRARITADDLASTMTSASGARILYARYRDGARIAQTVAETAVVRMSRSAGSVGLGTVIPVLAPAGATGVVDTASQQALAAPGGDWDAVVRAAEAAPWATVALDPAVIASVRLAADAAPPPATDLLHRLRDLPNQVVELPYADRDLTLARAAGEQSALAPTGFAGASVVAATGPDATPTPGPTTTPGASGTAVGDLTAWSWSEQRIAWPVPGTTSAADATAFGTARETVLLSSDDVRDTADRRAAGPLARIRSTSVLVSDATASALLVAAAGQGPAAGAALAQLMGVLASDAVTGDADAVLATVGRSTDPAGLDRVLSLLRRSPWIDGRSLADLASAQQPTAVDLQPRSVAPSRIATARALLGGEHGVRRFAAAIPAGAATVTGPARLALLGELSAAWRGRDADWAASAAAAERGFAATRGAVRIEQSSGINAIGSDGHLQVYVRNDLDVPVRVVVHPSVSNGRLQFTGRDVVVRVPPRSPNKASLAFRPIANGSTTVTLRLTTPSGAPIGGAVERTVNVSAGFDAIVAAGLLGALALLLALGVYRNVKRRGQPRSAAA